MRTLALATLLVVTLLMGCQTFSVAAVQNRMEDIDDLKADELSQARELEEYFLGEKADERVKAYGERFQVLLTAQEKTTDTLFLRSTFIADMIGTENGLKAFDKPLDNHVWRMKDRARKMEENNRKSAAELRVAQRLSSLAPGGPPVPVVIPVPTPTPAPNDFTFPTD